MCGRYTYFPRKFSDLRLTWKVDSIPILRPPVNIAGCSGSIVEVESLIPKPFELDEVVSIVGLTSMTPRRASVRRPCLIGR